MGPRAEPVFTGPEVIVLFADDLAGNSTCLLSCPGRRCRHPSAPSLCVYLTKPPGRAARTTTWLLVVSDIRCSIALTTSLPGPFLIGAAGDLSIQVVTYRGRQIAVPFV